jgi:hypothetical protein
MLREPRPAPAGRQAPGAAALAASFLPSLAAHSILLRERSSAAWFVARLLPAPSDGRPRAATLRASLVYLPGPRADVLDRLRERRTRATAPHPPRRGRPFPGALHPRSARTITRACATWRRGPGWPDAGPGALPWGRRAGSLPRSSSGPPAPWLSSRDGAIACGSRSRMAAPGATFGSFAMAFLHGVSRWIRTSGRHGALGRGEPPVRQLQAIRRHSRGAGVPGMIETAGLSTPWRPAGARRRCLRSRRDLRPGPERRRKTTLSGSLHALRPTARASSHDTAGGGGGAEGSASFPVACSTGSSRRSRTSTTRAEIHGHVPRQGAAKEMLAGNAGSPVTSQKTRADAAAGGAREGCPPAEALLPTSPRRLRPGGARDPGLFPGIRPRTGDSLPRRT